MVVGMLANVDVAMNVVMTTASNIMPTAKLHGTSYQLMMIVVVYHIYSHSLRKDKRKTKPNTKKKKYKMSIHILSSYGSKGSHSREVTLVEVQVD